MPRFDAVDAKNGAGWGCSCPAFRLGDPDPAAAFQALARSEMVTVEFIKEHNGCFYFTCWTEPDNRYSVVFDPNNPGGFCKHITAAAIHFVPWMHRLAEAAARLVEIEKQLDKLQREKARWEKKSSSSLKGS